MEVQWCFSQLCYCIPQTPFCFGNFLLEISTDSHFPLCFCYFYDGIEKRIRFEIGLFEPLETWISAPAFKWSVHFLDLQIWKNGKAAIYCRSTARAWFHPLLTNIIMRHHVGILIHPCLRCTNSFLGCLHAWPAQLGLDFYFQSNYRPQTDPKLWINYSKTKVCMVLYWF